MKLFYSIALLGLFCISMTACKTSAQSKDNSGIISISYKHTAGRGGAETITATPDSLIAEAVGGRFTEKPNFSKKIKAEDWATLLALVDLQAAEKTQSGDTRGQYDGPDEFFEIKTKDKELKLANVPDTDSYRPKLNQLKTKLKELTAQYK